jgi:hypothetical protein
MSDDLFHIVEDAQVILRHKGVYKQVKVFRRAGRVYAGWGSGFIQLLASGGTSKPDVQWESLPDDPAITRQSLHIAYVTPATVPRTIEAKPGMTIEAITQQDNSKVAAE